MKKMRIPHNALVLYGILAVLYILLSMLLPPNHTTLHQYHLSTLQYKVLILLIILPVIFIWFVAFYGYSKIKEYASLIQETEEGPAYTFMADGLMWLAWWLPISSIINSITTGIANSHPSFYGASIIISNYGTLLVPLVAFHILSSGSRTLLEKAGLRISIIVTKVLIFFFVLLGAVYCYLVFHNLGPSATTNPYYLAPWLLLLTIAVPYLYAWFLGLLASYEIHLVSRNSSGLLYKQALQHLSRGLVVIVGSSIAIQYLQSAMPRNGRLSLGYVLVLIYLILIFMAVGYALLAYGARKLKRIEEV